MTKERIYTPKEGLKALLEELQRKNEAGELECTALRVFRKDGTYEDIVLGGTDEERAAALADLRNADLH